jgi:hypothetical protein
MGEAPSDETFPLRGDSQVTLRRADLVVARALALRLAYRAICDARADERPAGGRGFDVTCRTDRFPLALSFPDRETRERFLAALRARLAPLGHDDA